MTIKLQKYALHDFLGISRDETFDDSTWDIVRVIAKMKIPKGKYNMWLDIGSKKLLVTEKRIKESQLALAMLGWHHNNR